MSKYEKGMSVVVKGPVQGGEWTFTAIVTKTLPGGLAFVRAIPGSWLASMVGPTLEIKVSVLGKFTAGKLVSELRLQERPDLHFVGEETRGTGTLRYSIAYKSGEYLLTYAGPDSNRFWPHEEYRDALSEIIRTIAKYSRVVAGGIGVGFAKFSINDPSGGIQGPIGKRIYGVPNISL